MSGNTSASGGYLRGVPPPPANTDDLTTALQRAVATMTGLPGHLVRPRWQATPPSQPSVDTTWAAVDITRVQADAYPFIRHDGVRQLPVAPGPGVDILFRHTTLTVMTTFYGPGADPCASAWRDGLYIQQNWEPLSALGVKLREVRDLVYIAELVNQQWIGRIDVELELRREMTRVYPVLNLDGADVVLRTDEGIVVEISV